MISELFNKVFKSNWNCPAITDDHQTINYKELYELSSAIKDHLAFKGAQQGDTVALHLPNGLALAASYLTCIMGNYRFVPISIDYTESTKQFILKQTSVKIILSDEDELLKLKPNKVITPRFALKSNAVSSIFFTSGTTGQPKGVCHSLNSLVRNVLAFNQALGLDDTIRLYHCLPMTYMAGFLNSLLSPWIAGGTVLVGPRFSSREALDFWARPLKWKANTLWLTPTIASLLVRLNRNHQIASEVSSKIKTVFCGTAPLQDSIRTAFFETFGCQLQESYGMSEVLLVSTQTKEEATTKKNSGQLLPDIKITYRNVEGINESEIIIHTPYVANGYVLENKIEPLDIYNGGIKSGDLGVVHSGGLSITGRIKDIIIRGGINISPVAVENILLQIPEIVEVAVIAEPHSFWGESITACIVADNKSSELEYKIQEYCVNNLNEGMRPDRYIYMEKLPRSSTGKVQKQLLLREIV
jgi:acyl-CoA synthetase (AMP-forming)/AMP-acid ligase II